MKVLVIQPSGETLCVASDQEVEAYIKASASGKTTIARGYHGYSINVSVEDRRSSIPQR